MSPSSGREKAWVSGPFTAVVRNPEEKRTRNGSFFTCELEDPDDPNAFLEATADIDFVSMKDRLIEISGGGVSREEYRGKPQVKCGRKTTARIIGGGQDEARRSAPPDRNAPAARTEGGAQRESQRPYGPAIGAALHLAHEGIMIHKLAVPGSPEYPRLLWEIASDVLRVNQYMESGHLAKPAAERGAPPARREQPPARRQPPPPEPHDHLPGDPPDERTHNDDPEEKEVPF